MPRSITVKGQTFPSLSAAAKAFGASGITGAHISSRLHMGWDPERAVSEPAGNRRKGITGPDGKSYRSCADLARAYGMDPGTVLDRIGKGISPELAVYPGDLHRIPAKDHLGNEYESLSEMARQYGCIYLDYLDDPVCRDSTHFCVSVHLNPAATAAFTRRLAHDVDPLLY